MDSLGYMVRRSLMADLVAFRGDYLALCQHVSKTYKLTGSNWAGYKLVLRDVVADYWKGV